MNQFTHTKEYSYFIICNVERNQFFKDVWPNGIINFKPDCITDYFYDTRRFSTREVAERVLAQTYFLFCGQYGLFEVFEVKEELTFTQPWKYVETKYGESWQKRKNVL